MTESQNGSLTIINGVNEMGRISTKENKTLYQLAREKIGLSREKASEITGIEPSKIERIENEKTQINPYDVYDMATAYKDPMLCNYYCANECPIGMKYVTEVKMESLKEITIEMLASLNSLEKQEDRMLEIARNGRVEESELEDFVFIQKELEQLSAAVDSLRMWSERMMATGSIDERRYKALMEEK